MPDHFSNRYGYGRRTNPAREVAPESVRVGLREVLNNIGFTTPSSQRQVICEASRARPNPYNWSEYPNIDTEVDSLIHDIEWFDFYNLCEKLNVLEEVREKGVMSDYSGTLFAHEMNKIFAEENVVYRFEEDGFIYPGGTKEFEQATNEAIEQLNEPEFAAPLEQFQKALGFRNALPPDHPNAIKEAATSLEATLQIISDKPGVALPLLLTNSTLGYDGHVVRVMKEIYGIGCAVQGARHASIGGLVPSAIETDWAIHCSASCIKYAISKYRE